MSGAYYNEIDPYAAEWLRNLIKAGHIAPGDVDERSIEDVQPSDLRKYTQCHFFAGIGVWSHSLRRAAWRDDRSVWTGSCPCQPFSAAGKGEGFSDERHLWPAWHYLIEQCRPPVVFGEQVASLDGLGWLDLVQADLEGAGYACGPVDLCAAGVGAPHIRQRLWFVAHASDTGLEKRFGISGVSGGKAGAIQGKAPVGSSFCLAGGLAYSDGRNASAEREQCRGQQRQQPEDSNAFGLADAECAEFRGEGLGPATSSAPGVQGANREWKRVRADFGAGSAAVDGYRAGPTNGFWRDSDWLGCTDGKWRPVEPSSFPLANGAPSRMGRLRAYGNAICAEAAATVITSYMGAA